MRTVAVIGASLAGLRTAQELRARGYEGRLIMVGEERHRPYDRPPLTKDFLAGIATRESLDLLDAEDETELDLDWRLGVRAERLDPANGRVVLSDCHELHVDGVVIATGGRARMLAGTHGIAGVHVLRTLDDALHLRGALTSGTPNVVVIGAGFIGAEVASTARRLGLSVTVLEALSTPLTRALGPELGAACAELHADNGTRLLCETRVHGLTTVEDGPRGHRVTGVQLADGRLLPADVVVTGIGMVPATYWLAGSGLTVDNGVHTDAGLVTALPNVVAVGDVANCPGPGGVRARHEHWTNAGEQAAVAAENLLAGHTARHHAPGGYVWSEQYSATIQLAGHPGPGDTVSVVDGSVADRCFVATYQRDGMVTGVLAMNNARLFNRLRRQAIRQPAAL